MTGLAQHLSLTTAFMLFAGCALVIAVAGSRMVGVVDRLADRTGLGEAVAGAVLLGMATSLPGSVLSVTAAVAGRPELAVGNALGGIAAQTLFLAIADLTYRRANLEHAAASLGNMLQASLLIALLGIILLARIGPEVTVFGIHPATILLLASYVYGLRLIRQAQVDPMWTPMRTQETRTDEPDGGGAGSDGGGGDGTDGNGSGGSTSLRRMWLTFAGLALIIGGAGWLIETSSRVISTETGLGDAAVGVFLTGIATSLPELITTLAAVRRGALTLAVAGIIGGNCYDTLFTAIADIAYREGSVYHAISDQVAIWGVLAVVMTAALVLGLLRRERQGPARIGFESLSIFALYGLGVLIVVIS